MVIGAQTVKKVDTLSKPYVKKSDLMMFNICKL